MTDHLSRLHRARLRASIGDLEPLREILKSGSASAYDCLRLAVRGAHPRHPIHAFALEEAVDAAMSPQPAVRAAAARLFVAVDRGAARRWLPQLLFDPAPTVQVDAATSLAELADPRGHEALVAVLREGPPPSVRAAVMAALGRDGSSAGLSSIEPGLRDPDARVRHAAIQAILDVGSDAAIPAIEHALDDEPDPAVRERLAAAVPTLKSQARQFTVSYFAAQLAQPTLGVER